METLEFSKGAPVFFEFQKNREKIRVYARAYCPYRENEDFITCITPHGSFFRVFFTKLNYLIDSEDLEKLRYIEDEALSINNNVYNNIFNTMFDFTKKTNEVY
jgi:hypothetical protein